MNMPRLLIAVVVGFIFIFASDFLVHGIWLAPDYKATADLWRSDAEMQTRFAWMLTAQFVTALVFVLIWAKGFAGRTLGAGASFGFLMGLALQTWAIVFYVVAPLPGVIATKWFLSGLLQAILLGVLVAAIYKSDARRVERGA